MSVGGYAHWRWKGTFTEGFLSAGCLVQWFTCVNE